jgi:Fur family ferric uptake transcriptional regulator
MARTKHARWPRDWYRLHVRNGHACKGLNIRSKAPASPSKQASQRWAKIEAQCRAQGIAWTAQRRIIAKILAEAVDHPDVLELHNRVSAIAKRISLATTYRTLRRFEAAGIVICHTFRDGLLRYEMTPAIHHDHVVNLQNGSVTDFRSREIERLQIKIAHQMGYQLVGHRLELYVVPRGAAARAGRSKDLPGVSAESAVRRPI